MKSRNKAKPKPKMTAFAPQLPPSFSDDHDHDHDHDHDQRLENDESFSFPLFPGEPHAQAHTQAEAPPPSRPQSKPPNAGAEGTTGPSPSSVGNGMAPKRAVFEKDNQHDEFLSALRETKTAAANSTMPNAPNEPSGGTNPRGKRSTHSVGSQKKYLENDLSSFYGDDTSHDFLQSDRDVGGKSLRSKTATTTSNSAPAPAPSSASLGSASTSKEKKKKKQRRSNDKLHSLDSATDASTASTSAHRSGDNANSSSDENAKVHGSRLDIDASNDGSGSDLPLPSFKYNRCFRFGLFAVVIAVMVLCTTLFHLYILRSEREYDDLEYEYASEKILDHWQSFWNQTWTSLEASSIAAQSQQNQVDGSPPTEWPILAELPTNFAFFAILPLIRDDSERARWEQFSVQHAEDWMGDRYDADTISKISPIHDAVDPDAPLQQQPSRLETGPYLPIWQHAPIDVQKINYNVKADPLHSIELSHSFRSRTVLISNFRETPSANQRTSSTTQRQNLHSTIYYPLLSTSTSASNGLYGTLLATFAWKDALPASMTESNTVSVAIHNACQQLATFQYEETGGWAAITAQAENSKTVINDHEEHSYAATTGHDDGASGHCPYSISIIPANRQNDNAARMDAWIYTSAMIVVFFVLLVSLIIYDHRMQRQQRKLVSSTIQSQAIVSSVFPKSVQNKLLSKKSHPHEYSSSSSKNNNNGSNSNSNNNFRKYPGATSGNASIRSHSRASGAAADDTNFEDNTTVNGGLTVQLESQKERLERFMSTHSATNRDDDSHHHSRNSISSNKRIDGKKPQLYKSATIMCCEITSSSFDAMKQFSTTFHKLSKKRNVQVINASGILFIAGINVSPFKHGNAQSPVTMIKFANDVVKYADKQHKPHINVRVGIHTGQVTGGQLPEQSGRSSSQPSKGSSSQEPVFQYVGDGITMAMYMMQTNTNTNNTVQCSKETMDLCTGKGHWFTPRHDMIPMNDKIITASANSGNGAIQTYWVANKGNNYNGSTSNMSSSNNSLDDPTEVSEALTEDFSKALSASDVIAAPPGEGIIRSANFQRLIDWSVELLSQQIKRILAQRQRKSQQPDRAARRSATSAADRIIGKNVVAWGSPRDECVPCIIFESNSENEPIDGRHVHRDIAANNDLAEKDDSLVNPDRIELSDKVDEQLRDFVTKVACSYQSNPFHCFEHACHVTMSLNKMLKKLSDFDGAVACEDFRRCIASDPFAHFAALFAALIHDVDHPGVPNGQLVREKEEMATLYSNKSVSEQNSIDLGWGLLMDSTYSELRRCLFTDDREKKRFRQLLVNLVIATDLFDPDLKIERNEKWQRALSNPTHGVDANNRKATIVLESIMQAADIAHTMQNWHVFKKWNRRLYQEMHMAYHSNRLPSDPTLGWYNGEIWFFDNYVIPLAQRLDECGVFGEAGKEFLKNAQWNRREWEGNGKELIKAMMQDMS
mmetsp:Transcript_26865/g.75436  ORF Transcript_26865/g.75436 Transcript_26865/m.75436 type:complete len:1451 (-) Transcript_26865:178-4530(-)